MYSWEQFVRYSVYCVNEQGSALFDETQGDEGLIQQMFDQLKEKQSNKIRESDRDEVPYYPPRRGYTRAVEKLDDLADNIIALRAEQGQWRPSATKFTIRPLFPAEAAKEMMRNRNRKIRDSRIKEAQERWRGHHDHTGA